MKPQAEPKQICWVRKSPARALALAVICFYGTCSSRAENLFEIELHDLKGRIVKPFSREGGGESSDMAQRSAKAHVFIFMAVDCPISNRYAPELRRLKDEFKEVRFVLVYPNADETAKLIQKRLKEYDLPFEVWRDTRHELVQAAQVRVTPEAAIFEPGRGWVYRGRIDDRFVDFGKQRPEATTRDLQRALQQVLAGKPAAPSSTPAIGCAIPPLETK